MHVSIGKRVEAGFSDYIAHSKNTPRDGRLVIKCNGYGSTPEGAGVITGTTELADRGLIVAQATYGSVTHFGRDAAQTLLTTTKTTFDTTAYGPTADKVLLWGSSMGGLLALLWALANPTLVQAVAVVIPAVSPIDIHDNNRGNAGYPAAIEAAYGGLSAWNTAKASHDPHTRRAEFAALDFPLGVWYSTDDDICISSLATEFITDSGAEGFNMGAVGHTYGPTEYPQMADFLEQYA